MRQIGEGTVRLLLEILAAAAMRVPESVTLPHTLVVRTSTAPPPKRSRIEGAGLKTEGQTQATVSWELPEESCPVL